MLVPIIFIVAFIAAVTGALLENSFLGAKVTLNSAVARYADVTIADAVADFTHRLASFVALHGTSGPWPQQTIRSRTKSICVDSAAPQCAFRYFISATLTKPTTDTSTSPVDAAQNLQGTGIEEQRISAVVTTTVLAPIGTVLGTRTRFLTYRVFATAPYAVISGSRDITTVNGGQSAAQGDTGGAASTSTSRAGEASPGFEDTRIHVRLTCSTIIKNVVPFVNDQQPIGNNGLPWGNAAAAAYEAPCTSADVPTDDFHDEGWINGDANASGWTQ